MEKELSKQKTLKSSLDNSANALMTLKKQFSQSENSRKSLSNKMKALQSSSAANLASVTKELNALKESHNSLKKEKVMLNNQYTNDMSDSDNDGVVSKLDKCPSSAPGSSVDSKGCLEIADADGDRVPDANDLCPNTASNSSVNKFGCIANQSITLKGVTFTSGSDKLTAGSLPIINAAAETLKQNPSIKVEVAGYTDNQGNANINQSLSKRRANSVSIQLIKQGVAANRLSAKGYGESNPIASNNTEAGRLTNRRVELKIR